MTFIKINDNISINEDHIVSIKKALPNDFKDDPTKLHSLEYRYYATLTNGEVRLIFSTMDEKEMNSFEIRMGINKTIKEYLCM